MSFVGIKGLQRDYGLSFATAEAILREQTALARRHYRPWFTLGGIGLAVALAGAFVVARPFSNIPFDFVFPCACLCTGIGELLARRRARAPIRAAARAAAQAD